MSKLTYKTVFSKYEKSLSHKFAQKSYAMYKATRNLLSKWFPLRDHERFMLEDHYSEFEKKMSEMPDGFDYSAKQYVAGKIELKYIDFFDYLPKEDVTSFKMQLHHFALTNEEPKFSFYRTREDEERIENMGDFFDGQAQSDLYSIQFSHNKFLSQNAPQLSLSIHNLSSSFALVQYRAYISDAFNRELSQIYKEKYFPCSDVYRKFNTPWYKPWRFGRSIYRSDDNRKKAVYLKISKVKWEIYKEIQQSIKVYFSEDRIFPPVFATFHTNIRPSSDKEKLDFWHSLGLNFYTDYSPHYNLCIVWDEPLGESEGIHLSAYCGGDYSSKSQLQEIAEYDIADEYAVYMVANTIRRIAERDIATCNKEISKTIKSKKATKLLKLRATVDNKMYYSYRFMSEFSGKTIDQTDFSAFKSKIFTNSSITEKNFSGLAEKINETKQQIDNIFLLLNNSTDYQTAKSNMSLQRLMMIITLLSLVVALVTLLKDKIDVRSLYQSFTEYIKLLMG